MKEDFDVPDKYDEYLLRLQQKNRVLKKLKAKDEKQIQLEQKEQGFSLYMNGANQKLGAMGNILRQSPQRPSTNKPLTAGGIQLEQKEQGFSLYMNGANQKLGAMGNILRQSPQRPSTNKPLTAGDNQHRPVKPYHGYQMADEECSRAKTAPSKVHRRNWQQQSLEIKTERGEMLPVKSRWNKDTYPEEAGDDYEDDFEVYESLKESIPKPQESPRQRVPTSVRSHIEHDDYDQMTHNLTLILEGASSDSDNEIDAADYNATCDGSEEDEESNDHLLLSLEDVRTLRRSLEANADIQKSITDQLGVGSTSTPALLEVDDGQSGDSSRGTVDEDIEEDIEIVTDSLDTRRNIIEPGDMIVLEFASCNSGSRQQRVLSAKRKPETQEVCMTTRQSRHDAKSSRDEPIKPAELRELRASSAPASRRPLSSQTKRLEKKWQVTDDMSAIQRAMKTENEAAASAKSGTRSAPPQKSTKKPHDVLPGFIAVTSPKPVPPAIETTSSLVSAQDLISSQNLSDDKLALVLDKVKKMDARSQRRLLATLGKVEESTWMDEEFPLRQEDAQVVSRSLSDEDDAGTSAVFTTPMLAPRAKSAAAIRSTQPTALATLVKSSPQLTTSTPNDESSSLFTTVTPSEPSLSLPSTSTIEVRIEVTSNWGHPSRIGLTEVQFFDQDSNKINLTCDDIRVVGSCSKAKGNVENIINGKTKTVKERNMWSWEFHHGNILQLIFNVQTTQGTSKSRISRIDVWNFNKSLKELGIGVKDVNISIDGYLVWSGRMDKGCGNQVFDYNKRIVIGNTDTEEAVQTNKDCNQRLKQLHQNNNGSQSLSQESNQELILDERMPPQESSQEREDDNVLVTVRESFQTSTIEDKTRPELLRSKTRILDEKRPPPEPPQEREDEEKTSNIEDKTRPELLRSKTRILDEKRPPPEPPQEREDVETTNIEDDKRPELSRSKTRILKCSTEKLQLPTVDDSLEIYTTPRVSSKSATQSEQEKQNNFDRATVVMKDSSHEDPEGVDQSMEEPSMMKQLQSIAGSKQRPIWLYSASESTTNGAKCKTNTKKPPWLGNFSEQSTEDAELISDLRGNVITSDDGKLELVGDEQEDTRWRQRVHSFDESDDQDDKQPIGRRSRAKWKSHQELSLEKSWTSLNLFNKSQMGRISSSVNTDIVGDSLDEYLSRQRAPHMDEGKDDSSDEFEIPLLPIGQRLTINIRTTWGDKHYVGLNGIEIFKSNGEPVHVMEISADPSDINVLPEYSHDPRVVSNLIDGVNRTRDDTHMWLAPYMPGTNHWINVVFTSPAKIALIRIWNYNKSRIHSFRGTRDVEISLDGQYIFKGEIERASGITEGENKNFGDTILFTEDEEILELISRHDEVYCADEDWFSSSQDEDATPRPKTADQGEERPMTQARMFRDKKIIKELMAEDDESQPDDENQYPEMLLQDQNIESPTPRHVGSITETRHYRDSAYSCRYIKLNFTSTWGDIHYLGLTGLEILDEEGEVIPVTMTMMDARPRDLNQLPGYGRDDRTLDKLIDGANVTTSDEHMWLVPFTEGEDHIITVDFGREVQISGLRIWNYNKTPEDTYRGAKMVHVLIDNQQVSPSEGFLIRKGPGFCHFDFAQEINFLSYKLSPLLYQSNSVRDILRQSSVAMAEPSQEYVPMHMPCGFVFQFQLISAWGDPYYIGLNGLEFYDENGDKITLTETNVAAYPFSVNVLDDVSDDIRTPDKLIDGINDTCDGRHMWLAPIVPHVINRVYIIFDQPVAVSMIKIWNYSKTSKRGVKEFGLLVDDLLVYNGILGQVSSAARGILPTVDVPTPYHTIIFTDNEQLRLKERHTIIHNSPHDQDVKMTNDYHVMANYSDPKKQTDRPADQALRPKTSVHGRGAALTQRR